MSYLYPLFNPECRVAFGGAEVDMYNVATALAEDPNYEVSVYVSDFGQKKEEIHQGVKVRRLRWDYPNRSSLLNRIRKYLYLFYTLLTIDTDIVISKTAAEMDGWVELFCSKLGRKKHIHRLASDKDTTPEQYLNSEGKRFYKLHQYGLHGADLILAQSEVQRQRLLENTGLESIVIANGFRISNISPIEKKSILWVSRGVPLKRPDLFLSLAERMPDENFVLIMPKMTVPNQEQQAEFNAYYQAIVDKAAQLPNVHYIPQVPFHEIQPWFDRAKLFVNTSEYEGFPNTFIQACAGCTPILSFAVNPDSFINNYDLGYYCEDNIDKAEDFIRSLSNEKISKLGDNAANYIREHHNISKTILQYKDVFTKLNAE
ncbi:MAG: glycosyltransferase family 4 protein [Oscillospiraceae bacterium]